MKKKIKTYRKNFKMPLLFREDLESIEEVIKKELNPREYKLDLGSFEYQEIKEISENTDPANEFHIQTVAPYISINFYKNSARIYVGDDDINTVGAVKKITDVIFKRERKFLWCSSKFGQFFAFPVFILSIISLSQRFIFSIGYEYSIITMVSSIIWFIAIILSEEYKFSIIEFTYKKNKSNFFSRNKDQIGINIIVAILSFLVGWFLKVK